MNKFITSINKYFSDAKGVKIDTIFDGGDRYLFKVRNTAYGNPEVDTMDPWYVIDKKSLKIKGFQPPENIKWFNNTLQNEVKAFL